MSSRLARMALKWFVALSAHAARPGSACGARDEIVVVFLVVFLDVFTAWARRRPAGATMQRGRNALEAA